ncbi:sulfatase [Planctomycetota bacterium]
MRHLLTCKKPWLILIALLILFWAPLSLAATPSVTPLRRPNVLWINLDDGRADSLGCYGSAWAKTPHLDALAEQGVRFATAIAQSPVCVPSRRSIKTGHYSYEIGPVAMGKEPETAGHYLNPQKMATLAKGPILLDAWTAVGMKPINVGKVHGFPKHWDLRGDAEVLFNVTGKPTQYFLQTFGNDSNLLDTERVFTKTHGWQIGGVMDIKPQDTETWRLGDMARRQLRAVAEKGAPFFLRVSFHAPHVACYVPRDYFIDPRTIDLPLPTPQELQNRPKLEQGPLQVYAGADLTREQIDLCRGTYYGMVSLVDVQVGRLVQVLRQTGQFENTIIAFTSDQGFQLGEHGLWKKRAFYEGNVKVPLLLIFPQALPRGKVIQEPVEMLDFLPTLMELSHLSMPATIRGKSLVPLIRDSVKGDWRKACFSEIDHSQSMYPELRQETGRRVMVRTKQWKLIMFMDSRVTDKDGALYDLQDDPDEKNNLYHDPQYQDIIQKLEALAQQWDQKKI